MNPSQPEKSTKKMDPALKEGHYIDEQLPVNWTDEDLAGIKSNHQKSQPAEKNQDEPKDNR